MTLPFQRRNRACCGAHKSCVTASGKCIHTRSVPLVSKRTLLSLLGKYRTNDVRLYTCQSSSFFCLYTSSTVYIKRYSRHSLFYYTLLFCISYLNIGWIPSYIATLDLAPLIIRFSPLTREQSDSEFHRQSRFRQDGESTYEPSSTL